MRSFLLLASSAAALAACSPYDPNLGGSPYLCAAEEPRCPEGYTCQDDGTNMVCIGADGPSIDAPVTGFQCADDGVLEGSGNDSIQTAYALPPNLRVVTFGPLSICPEGDKDTFMVQMPMMGSIDATTTWESGMPVSVSILGPGGATLKTSASNGERTQTANVQNLPPGSYYVQIFAAATVKNNYRVRITATP